MENEYVLKHTGKEIDRALDEVLTGTLEASILGKVGEHTDSPIIAGEGESSVVQSGTGARALTENSIAFGNSIAGSLGYYFEQIYSYVENGTQMGKVSLSIAQPYEPRISFEDKHHAPPHCSGGF